MKNPLTKEEIEELEKLEQEATPGPWELEDPWKTSDGANLVRIDSGPTDFCQASKIVDNRIIAAARNTLPRLLGMAREWHDLKAELEAAKAENANLRDKLQQAVAIIEASKK